MGHIAALRKSDPPLQLLVVAALSMLMPAACTEDMPSSSPSPDLDGDLFTEMQGDCDDHHAAVYPGADEVCNLMDDDCDGQVDEENPLAATVWYLDRDRDAYGDATSPCKAIAAGPNFVSHAGDCRDDDSSIHPSAPELCADGIDSDCDGIQPGCGIYGELLAADADAVYVGEATDDYAGFSLSISGDLNGDGLDDIVIGAPYAALDQQDESTWEAGRVYIHTSPAFGARPLVEAVGRIDGTAYSHLGYSLASGVDVNGDGRDELVVGAPLDGLLLNGVTYLFAGPVEGTLLLSASHTYFAGPPGDLAGQAVALGDVDQDGTMDILSGSNNAGGAEGEGGALWAMPGTIPGEQDIGAAVVSAVGANESKFGFAIDFGGDLNGDGIPDLVVGAPTDSTQGCCIGVAYVFFGPLSGRLNPISSDARLYGTRTNDGAGASLSTGDVDGDGWDDLLIGSPSVNCPCSQAEPPNHWGQGYAYLVYGPISGSIDLDAADATFEGLQQSAALGHKVSLRSDLDGDGRAELVMTSPNMALEGPHTGGATYIFYGPREGHHYAHEADATISGSSATNNPNLLGSGLAAGGDVNADGYDDLLIGAAVHSGPGSAYLFLGGPH